MQNIWQHIYAAFIEADRWKLYLKGLGVTLEVSFFAALLGILIGTIAAFLKLSTRKNGSKTIASRIASAYIDIIRGTPTTVQLLIMWSGILATCKNSVLIASLTFGINSGAYVAEIVRAGILAVDKGQMEGARSCGMTNAQAMRYVVMPQAVKNILPAIGNEFVTMVKETSIIQYLGIGDLMYNNGIVVTSTYNPLPCYYISAIIYLALNIILGKGLNIFEGRLRKSER